MAKVNPKPSDIIDSRSKSGGGQLCLPRISRTGIPGDSHDCRKSPGSWLTEPRACDPGGK